jgi:hypothetical protein
MSKKESKNLPPALYGDHGEGALLLLMIMIRIIPAMITIARVTQLLNTSSAPPAGDVATEGVLTTTMVVGTIV